MVEEKEEGDGNEGDKLPFDKAEKEEGGEDVAGKEGNETLIGEERTGAGPTDPILKLGDSLTKGIEGTEEGVDGGIKTEEGEGVGILIPKVDGSFPGDVGALKGEGGSEGSLGLPLNPEKEGEGILGIELGEGILAKEGEGDAGSGTEEGDVFGCSTETTFLGKDNPASEGEDILDIEEEKEEVEAILDRSATDGEGGKDK